MSLLASLLPGAAGLVCLALALYAAVQVLYPPLWRDLYTAGVMVRVIFKAKRALKSREFCIDRLERHARDVPEVPFLKFKDQTYSYRQSDQAITLAAHALRAHGIKVGDTVALIMTNEPAFIWIFFGAQKLGAKCALVNHHLKEDSIVHSVTACCPALVVVGTGDNLPERVQSVLPHLPNTLPVVTHGPAPPTVTLTDLYDVISDHDAASLEPIDPKGRVAVTHADAFAFIYTSGTTGLPKPAIITHKKVVLCSHVYGCMGFVPGDVMYVALPLYHASAMCLALLNTLNVGGTLVLREKFSASQFWPDCVRYRVTAVQYIGEMLRYLVNCPETPSESQHSVRLAVGNGLRPDIWPRFTRRFKVPNIYEFYGSTEGPASVTNMFNVEGSVGRLSPLLQKAMKMVLVKVDPKTKEPYRNAIGRCETISPGCSGILLSQLNARQTFEGYVGPAAHTKARIMQDVLDPGDFWFNSQDVFRLDREYNLFFEDRIGDSFRWKGENVSTAEVSNVMNSANFVEDTNVFGIQVPGMEGKAGMAAVSLKDHDVIGQGELEEIGELCRRKLPGYARPRFLRIQRQMSLTSTFKQLKTDLVKEGFDPGTVDEPLFYLEKCSDSYKPLDDAVYNDIIEGRVSL